MNHIPIQLADHVACLPMGLRNHIMRVCHVARELAEANGVDVDQAELAVTGHDIARAVPSHELLAQARLLGIPIHPVEEALPILLHGPVGAELLRRQFGVTDEVVLAAVRWHSTANRGLSILGRLVFLADKLDPQKVRRHPDRARIRKLALQELDQGVLEFLTTEVQRFIRDGGLIHPASVEARNELLEKEGARHRLGFREE